MNENVEPQDGDSANTIPTEPDLPSSSRIRQSSAKKLAKCKADQVEEVPHPHQRDKIFRGPRQMQG